MNLKKLKYIHKSGIIYNMSTSLNLKCLKFRPTYNTIAHNITKFHIKVTERFRNTSKTTSVRIPF